MELDTLRKLIDRSLRQGNLIPLVDFLEDDGLQCELLPSGALEIFQEKPFQEKFSIVVWIAPNGNSTCLVDTDTLDLMLYTSINAQKTTELTTKALQLFLRSCKL